MRYYPIFLDIRGRRAVVVGGGKVAERKVRKLLRAGAEVRVISPQLTPRLGQWVVEKKISVTRRPYRRADISHGARGDMPLLVFAATNDPAVQLAVCEDARAAGALVNVASDAAQCDFIVPASLARGNLHLAISTSGTDPSLARWLRQRLATATRKSTGRRKKSKVKT
jgi:precorrin-2 dehydrogenase/sirohydrochlorin ferrochelatase